MRNVRVVLELEKVIPLYVKEGEDPELKVGKIVDEMIEKDKKNHSYLSSFEIYEKQFEWIVEPLIFSLVKKAIDSFDPYFVHPDSYDEYDGESRRIAEKIKIGMVENEIAEIMKEEFNWSFSAQFTREDFSYAAETVLRLLGDCLNEPDINEENTKELEFVYIKLLLIKEIPVKASGEDEGIKKALKMVFGEIDSDKEVELPLSSFNISVGWGTREVS